MTKPNVILVYTDDQGSVDAGCYGSNDLHTPTIDRIAETGICFTNMLHPLQYAQHRGRIVDGRIPARAGVPANVSSTKGNPVCPVGITIAELLKSNGYKPGHIGKWHIGYTLIPCQMDRVSIIHLDTWEVHR